MTKKMI